MLEITKNKLKVDTHLIYNLWPKS